MGEFAGVAELECEDEVVPFEGFGMVVAVGRADEEGGEEFVVGDLDGDGCGGGVGGANGGEREGLDEAATGGAAVVFGDLVVAGGDGDWIGGGVAGVDGDRPGGVLEIAAGIGGHVGAIHAGRRGRQQRSGRRSAGGGVVHGERPAAGLSEAQREGDRVALGDPGERRGRSASAWRRRR